MMTGTCVIRQISLSQSISACSTLLPAELMQYQMQWICSLMSPDSTPFLMVSAISCCDAAWFSRLSSKPMVSYMASGMPSFAYLRMCCVTGFPMPVSASFSLNTEFISVLFPEPVLPATMTLSLLSCEILS